jgi:hypothetical protein
MADAFYFYSNARSSTTSAGVLASLTTNGHTTNKCLFSHMYAERPEFL